MWMNGLTRRGFVRRALTAFMLTAAMLGASGCGDDDNGPSSLAGTYSLRTIAGESLPVEILETSGLFFEGETYTDGEVVLRSNGTFDFLVEGTDQDGNDVSISGDGEWSRNGNTVTFEADEGDVTATVDGNRLIVNEAVFGYELVFRK
jgi:hypothetical protein